MDPRCLILIMLKSHVKGEFGIAIAVVVVV